MKKFLSLLLVGLLVVALAACGNGTKSGSDKEAKVIKIGATGQSFPNTFKDGEKLTGFDVEVTEAIAKNLGYEVKWTLTDFAGLMGQLEAGKLDTVANNVAITEERKAKYNFTDGYTFSGTQIAVKADNDKINSLDDLKGKTISAVIGSNQIKNFEAWDKNKIAKVKPYDTRESAMHEAVTGKVDGYVNSSAILKAEIKKSKLPLKLVGEPISHDVTAFPFAKNEEGDKLLKAFNEELKKLREDGTLKKLSEKYYGEDITIE